MPEVWFDVRWTDGTVLRCYSPSTVVRQHFAAGTPYPLAEFVARSRTALHEASARVQARYGAPCGRAAAQLAEIERRAAGSGDGTVTVLAFVP